MSEPSWYPEYLSRMAQLDRARHARRMAEPQRVDMMTPAKRYAADLTAASRQIRRAP